MIDTHAIKVAIVDNNMTQKQVAEALGVTPKTFGIRMKTGIFKSNEMDSLIELLNIEHPERIFFAQKVTQ